MSDASVLVPQYVLDDWLAALEQREPRALELAYALSFTLPASPETDGLKQAAQSAQTKQAGDGALSDTPAVEIAPEVLALLEDSYRKYAALTTGDFIHVQLGNPNVLAFERNGAGERILVVNNLARVSQPVKFNTYAAQEGWDILNRVEFTFPTRAQLEAYEFLWLLVE